MSGTGCRTVYADADQFDSSNASTMRYSLLAPSWPIVKLALWFTGEAVLS